MNQEEIHCAATVQTALNGPRGERGIGSKCLAYLPCAAGLKFEVTSGYPQDAERR
jgi:hypothetical protein